jgi:lipopolysaccharide/colanic/teichoic acid biosynthesis glycosyltransferase
MGNDYWVSDRPAAVAVLDSPLLIEHRGFARASEPHPVYDACKRTLDIVVAVALLLLSLPLLALVCLAIFLATRRSPLLAQERVGYMGRRFRMLKLRTMDAAADAEGADRDSGPFADKPQDDPRVTTVGRPLRRTSIDELPQLLNVIAGQMSLVGPRPGLPHEVAAYPPGWRRRLTVQPGLSGLWQVSGRSDIPGRRWMALDRLYLRRRSLLLDGLILLRTVPAVLSMRGAR